MLGRGLARIQHHLAFLTLCMTSTLLASPTYESWGNLRLGVHFVNLEEESPTMHGGTDSNSQNNMEYTPAITLGCAMNVMKVRFHLFGNYEYAYMRTEDKLLPNLFEKESEYPQSFVEHRKSLHFNVESSPIPHLSLGLYTEKLWVKSVWQQTTTDAYSRILIIPWFGILWNTSHQSYIAILTEQNLHTTDEERTYKMESRPLSGLFNFQISHLFTLSPLRMGAAYRHEKLIFQDFWYDQIEDQGTLGVEWKTFPTLSVHSVLGWTRRNFLHPWKRNGPCGQALGARTSTFYLHDAENCFREEKDTHLQFGLSWDIFKELSLNALFESHSTLASEEEFTHSKRGLAVTLSWQSEKSPFKDPMRIFLPWFFRGHLLN